MAKDSIVCMLLVNDLAPMSNLALSSILESTNSRVVIGYVNPAHIGGLSKNERIHFLDLNSDGSYLKTESHKYSDYSTLDFFQVVLLKWKLFEEVLINFAPSILIYSDFDVVWFRDISTYVLQSFNRFPEKQIIIQDSSDTNFLPSLCMGLFAIRNSDYATKVIAYCKKDHASKLQSNPRIGDDTIITDYYNLSNNSEAFLLLPQKTFPTGNMATMYKRQNLFPGVESPNPYIFHANYVVGVHKKSLMLRRLSVEVASRKYLRISKSQSFVDRVELTLRFFKNCLK